jgi:hypothetical protein
VDLPDPFAPISAAAWPGASAKSGPDSTTRPPNDRARAETAKDLRERTGAFTAASFADELGELGDPDVSVHLADPVVVGIRHRGVEGAADVLGVLFGRGDGGQKVVAV